MVYEVDEYKLYGRKVTLKGGREQTIYFFCKSGHPKSGAPCDLPEGYKLGGRSKKTGLPYLVKI